MAISWDDIAGGDDPVADTAAGLERELITTAADGAKAAAADKRAWWRLGAMRARSRGLLRRLIGDTVAKARAAVADAAHIGRLTAERDLVERGATVSPIRQDQIVAENAAKQISDDIHSTVGHALNSTDDMFRRTLMAINAQPMNSTAARLRVAQQALDELASNGVTGYVDKAGRRWNLVSYIEMATRTVAHNAAVDAHTATLTAHGRDLVTISAATACCPLCAPWDGRVLTISGLTAPDGPQVPVAGSLADARAAGWGHPNCRCVLETWSIGDPIPEPGPPPSPESYRATQRLRGLERGVRAAKRRRAAALTPEAARRANSHTRLLQRHIREHVARHGIARARRREQIGRAL